MVVVLLIAFIYIYRNRHDFVQALKCITKPNLHMGMFKAYQLYLVAFILLVSIVSVGILFRLKTSFIALLSVFSICCGVMQLHIICCYQNQKNNFQSLYLFLSSNASFFRNWEKVLPCLEHIVSTEPSFKSYIDIILSAIECGESIISAYRKISTHYLVVTLAVIMEMAETYGNAGLDHALLSYEEDLDQWKAYTEKLNQELLGMRLKVLLLTIMSIGIAYLSIGMLSETVEIVHSWLYQYAVTGFLIVILIVLMETMKGMKASWFGEEECID
ncbi:15'-monooxygenase [Erysipelothrix amsterdamensis]|uniref:15'-monooxygenase n=1 Tax=Erysipelothrix amsterdamensis TaxID=2929157 RepID=A0AAU9VH51_9FIRM|nr:15'-monooxygenase [Erysipelothrix sp. A18Y020d]CAH2761051.1 15'-monooxygenase [Erysipelothrix sp. A18Y020d]